MGKKAPRLLMKKGTVHEICHGGTMARVVPSDNSQIVTLPLIIPFYWRAEMGNIQVGESVYFDEDNAGSGMIHGRVNGEWDFTIRRDLTVTDDLTASGVSVAHHKHIDSQNGETQEPS